MLRRDWGGRVGALLRSSLTYRCRRRRGAGGGGAQLAAAALVGREEYGIYLVLT